MLVETVLNRCHYFKGFRYSGSRFEDGVFGKKIVIDFLSRKNGLGRCRECGKKYPTYDHQDSRVFHFIPLWGFPVELIYAPRRVLCPEHGIRVESLPFVSGKSPLTDTFKIFLSQWARRLAWKEVAQTFKVGWNQVFEAVKYVVDYGLKHRDLSQVRSLGIDEIQYRVGHHYLTLVYQVDRGCRRLLWIGKSRKAKTLLRFFWDFGKERTQKLEAICSDIWKPYLKVIRKKAHHCLHILDRFHIMKKFNGVVQQRLSIRPARRKPSDSDRRAIPTSFIRPDGPY